MSTPKRRVSRVIFIRHGESIWNVTDPSRALTTRFTGWADVKLTELGYKQAAAAGRSLKRFNIIPHIAYTSLLQRSKATLKAATESAGLDLDKIPVINSWRLNERHYGGLVGLSKEDATELMGKDLVTSWRRSWDLAPPPTDIYDPYDWRHLITSDPITVVSAPGITNATSIEKDIIIPDTESLEQCAKRSVLLWDTSIAPRLKLGRTIIVVAHANTIRGLVKLIDGDYMTIKDVQEVRIPSAVPLIYEFSCDVLSHGRLSEPVPIAEPTKLGMRGRYMLTKELIHLSDVLQGHDKPSKKRLEPIHSPSSSSSSEVCSLKRRVFVSKGTIKHFEGLVDGSFNQAREVCSSGVGKHVPISITNYKGVYVYVNEAWTALTGYSPEEVLGKQWKFLHGKDTSRESVCDMNAKVHSGQAAISTIINYHRNGYAFESHMSIIPIYDWLYNAPEQSLKNYNCDSDGINIDDIGSNLDMSIYGDLGHFAPTHFVCIVNNIVKRPDLSPHAPIEPIHQFGEEEEDDHPVLTETQQKLSFIWDD
eukprot:gene1233-2391_t